MFQNIHRPNKRRIQFELTERLQQRLGRQYSPKKTYILSGPNPKSALQQYKGTNLANEFVLIEQDPKVHAAAQRQEKLEPKEYGAQKIRYQNKNIFQLSRHELQGVNGLDLDLCKTITTTAPGIQNLIKNVLRYGKPEVFWLRITNSLRGVKAKETEEKIKEIVYHSAYPRYYVKNVDRLIYSDKQGPMHIWQCCLNKQGLSTQIKRKDAQMSKNTRSFKSLSAKEQEMARILSSYSASTSKVKHARESAFTSQDVAELFSLPITSIAALKAHYPKGLI